MRKREVIVTKKKKGGCPPFAKPGERTRFKKKKFFCHKVCCEIVEEASASKKKKQQNVYPFFFLYAPFSMKHYFFFLNRPKKIFFLKIRPFLYLRAKNDRRKRIRVIRYVRKSYNFFFFKFPAFVPKMLRAKRPVQRLLLQIIYRETQLSSTDTIIIFRKTPF